MARKNNTPAPPVPDSFRENYRSEYAPVPCGPSFKCGIDRLPDDVAGRLLKAILEHSTSGGAAAPAGMDEFAFDMLISKVDEFLMGGMERRWRNERRAKAGAAGRWGGTPEEAAGDNAQGCLSMHKDAKGCLSISKEEKNKEREKEREKESSKEKEKDKRERTIEKTEKGGFFYLGIKEPSQPPNPLSKGAGVGGDVDVFGRGDEGWNKWFENWTGKLEKEVNLSDYLTGPEEDELRRANFDHGGYTSGAVESFVTSGDFSRDDPVETKKKKLLEHKEKYDAFHDGKQIEFGTDYGMAIDKAREEKEYKKAMAEARDEKELRAVLKAKADTLPGYADGQRPQGFEEMERFCGDLGAEDFHPIILWREMEFHGWEIKEKDTWRAIKSWKGYVIYRIAAQRFGG